MKMQKIIDSDEAAHILEEPITAVNEFDLVHKDDHDWLLVGGIQKTKGVYRYGFRNKSTMTMWCRELEIRRKPTTMEWHEILELLEMNEYRVSYEDKEEDLTHVRVNANSAEEAKEQAKVEYWDIEKIVEVRKV